MRLVLLSEVFCKGRGYLENMLPKYFARLGVDTHVVTTDLSPFFRVEVLKRSCDGFAEPMEPGTIENVSGFTLHVLGHRKVAGHMRMVGLREKLAELRPDVVQTMTPIGWISLDAALFKMQFGYKLFTGSHHHASVFPLAAKLSPGAGELLRCRLTRTLPGLVVNQFTEKCYAIAPDCADIASRFFGVSGNKVSLCPLGVDTELFNLNAGEEGSVARKQLRSRLGFSDSDIVCIYSGRFSEDKNPLLLAKAVAELSLRGKPFRGLFVGNGIQAKTIEECRSCVTHPFVPVQELPAFFRAADIGVWPTEESMSMLDAAACGLPIVANHTISTLERISGNGLTYKLNDLGDLIRVLNDLQDKSIRQRLGAVGAEKMAREFSWSAVAKRRLRDYDAALTAMSTEPSPARPVSKDPARTGQVS